MQSPQRFTEDPAGTAENKLCGREPGTGSEEKKPEDNVVDADYKMKEE